MRLTLLTMTQVADRSGLPLTTVSGLYNGDNGASLKTVEKLANGTGCNAATLFPELEFTDLREAAVA